MKRLLVVKAVITGPLTTHLTSQVGKDVMKLGKLTLQKCVSQAKLGNYGTE